jgi:type IV pilus assembly protein PilC
MKFTREKSYHWSGINLQGKKIQGTFLSDDLRAAKNHLHHQGITFLKIKKQFPIKFTLRKKKVSFLDTMIFYRQLATLITAGVPLTRGLQILLKNHDHTTLSNLIREIKNDIECGKSLSTAMRKHPDYFDTLTRHLIEIGEHSGTLDRMLLRIATHKEKTHELKNKIKQALSYPCLILFVAVIVTTTLLTYVVPQFAELFQDFHGSLPYLTRLVLHLSSFICHYYWLASIPVLAANLFFYYYKKIPSLKLNADILILKLPCAGNLIKKFILARFTRTLATTSAAGTPINDALKMLIEINRNEVFKNATRQLHTDIIAGSQLHKAMQNTGVFPVLAIQMTEVGEESGTLEQMLEKIAGFYESEIDYWISHFSQLLEPLIIIILGVLIGGLVVAMYLPIFKLGTIL